MRIRLVNSVNPDRIAGQKTAAFEICDQLGDAPTHHFLPVGNAGNITAYWAGYREYQSNGLSARLPKMMGYQAAESAPIVLGHPIDDPHTVATAIKIGNPASWKSAEAARDQSGGMIDMVTDAEILAAYRLIAAQRSFRRAGLGGLGGGRAQVRRDRRSSSRARSWSARSPVTGSRIPTRR